MIIIQIIVDPKSCLIHFKDYPVSWVLKVSFHFNFHQKVGNIAYPKVKLVQICCYWSVDWSVYCDIAIVQEGYTL